MNTINTIWFNVYKQYHGLKRQPWTFKAIQLHEGFELQYEQLIKKKKEKEKLFQKVDEISEGRKNNTVSLALSRKEDEDILYDKYPIQKESEKKQNKLEEGEINRETEMGEISEEDEMHEFEIDEKVKEKKRERRYQ